MSGGWGVAGGERRVLLAALLAAVVLVGTAATATAEDGLRVVEVRDRSSPVSSAPAYAAALLASAGVLCFALGLRTCADRSRVDERMAAYVAPPVHPTQRKDDRPSFRARALVPAVAWLARMVGNLLPDRQIERIRTHMALAGMPYSRQLTQFLAAKAGLAIGAALLTSLYLLPSGESLLKTLGLALAAGALGFYLPGLWLARRIAHRRRQISRALPDALDLLSISVSAGLGFDGAMLEVVQRWKNPLGDEFAAVLRDLKFGKARRDALRELAERTGVEDVTDFVAAVIQADELGTPIKETLQIQAEQMRVRRRHRAEELARKATIKMLIPMAIFIFPAMFIVLVGPAVPSLRTFLQ